MIIVDNILLFSFPRSGTHFLIDAILNNFQLGCSDYFELEQLLLCVGKDQELKSSTLTKTSNWLSRKSNISNVSAAEDVRQPFLIKAGHHSPDYYMKYGPLIRQQKCIYIYRNPYDVMTSHYHYETMAYSKKRFDTIGSFLHSAHKYSSEEGEMSIVECWKYHVTQWMSMANVHFISMDKMLRDFDNEMCLLKNFLEVPTIGKSYLKPKKLPYNFVSQLLIKTISRFFDLNYGVTGIVGRDKARKDIFTKNDLQYITDITGDTLQLLGTD